MSLEPQDIGRMLDDFNLGLVMADPEDLIALGGLIEKIEKLVEVFQSSGLVPAVDLLFSLKKAVESIILEQVADKEATMEQMGQGASLLQDIFRNFKAGIDASIDVSSFITTLKSQTTSGPVLTLDTSPGRPPESVWPGTETTPRTSERQVVRGPAQVNLEPYDVGADRDLFFSFITESIEHIQSIEVNSITLEQDPQNLETINAIFRPFHTLKGVSGFLNLPQIHALTHEVENLLDDARNERLPVSPAFIDAILDAVDLLKKMIRELKSAVENGGQVGTDFGLAAFLERIKAIQQGDVPAESAEEPSPYGGMKLGEILIAQGMISEHDLEEVVANQQQARLRQLGDILLASGRISRGDLDEALRRQLTADDRTKMIGEILIETGKIQPDLVSLAIKEQEKLREPKLGELLIRENQADAREVAAALREQKKFPTGTGLVTGQTVKVETVKLDGLVDMVGELVIAQSLVSSNDRIAAFKDQKLLRDLSHMSRITSELQRTAMSMRMVPIRQTFQKMIRLVRDLSRKSGKLVELDMDGEETEIDRNMVETIYDPLVHMVRNSVDHGIESPGIREKKGKDTTGHIVLRAFHQGGNVVIQIVDDGQGLDARRIISKAIERGLIAPEEHLSETTAFNLIFQPGFSTAEKVTDVSGRGVGMDVVKKTIEKLRGKVEVASRPDHGTTITIRLPLTLAIIDGMIVRVGTNRYILPTVAIRESFRPRPQDYFTVKGQGELIKVRENLLPLVRLGEVLGSESTYDHPTAALVVVVENEGKRRCLMVDEVLGKQEVVIKSLGERLKHIKALAGGSIMGDGRVGLILDIGGLFTISDGVGGRSWSRGGPTVADDFEMDEDWGMGPS